MTSERQHEIDRLKGIRDSALVTPEGRRAAAAKLAEMGVVYQPASIENTNLRNDGATEAERRLVELLVPGRGLAVRVGAVVLTATGHRYACEDDVTAMRLVEWIAAVGLPTGGSGAVPRFEPLWSDLQAEALEVMAGYADGGL